MAFFVYFCSCDETHCCSLSLSGPIYIFQEIFGASIFYFYLCGVNRGEIIEGLKIINEASTNRNSITIISQLLHLQGREDPYAGRARQHQCA